MPTAAVKAYSLALSFNTSSVSRGEAVTFLDPVTSTNIALSQDGKVTGRHSSPNLTTGRTHIRTGLHLGSRSQLAASAKSIIPCSLAMMGMHGSSRQFARQLREFRVIRTKITEITTRVGLTQEQSNEPPETIPSGHPRCEP
jgi:hypothetical protein